MKVPTPPHEVRVAWSIAALVAVCVFALARIPLRGEIELDLRRGDDAGGWSQLTVVGFSYPGREGRTLPSPVGRRDLRIVSNRPLPAAFELAIEGRTVDDEQRASLELSTGGDRQVLSFDRETRLRAVPLRNPEGARTVFLRVEPETRLGVQRIVVRELGDRS